MSFSLSACRDRCLEEIQRRRPMKHAHIDFAAILDQLVSWSQDRHGRVFPHEPRDQNTIGFAIAGNGHVLWRVYPRMEDGAKISVLTHWLRKQPQADRERLAPFVTAVSSRLDPWEDKELDVPVHLLATGERMAALLALLDQALDLAESRSVA